MKAQKIVLAIVLTLNITVLGFTQSENEIAPSIETPYHTVYTHLYYLQPETYVPSNAALAFPPDLDSIRRERLAIQLKQILDGKGLYVNVNTIPQDSNYVDTLSRRSIFLLFPDELPEIFLEKIGGAWYYSTGTIREIPSLHRKVYPLGTDRILNWLPHSGSRRVLGLMGWQYLGLLLMLVLAYLAYLLLSRLIRPLVNLLAHRRFKALQVSKGNIWRLAKTLSFFLIVKFLQTFLPILQLPIQWSEVIVFVLKLLTIIIVMFLLLRLVAIAMEYFERLTSATESKLDDQLLPIVSKILKFIIIIVAIFQILRVINVDITAIIAGISIGGLALALAAQDTVKNLIGSLNIFVDKPFQIGDYVIGGDFEGTIEEVGFRTTRIRTVDQSVISVPNARVSDVSVNNLGVRPMRHLNTTIGITYDTPADLIELFLQGLKEIILNHPRLNKEAFHVRLKGFGDSSINIMFRVYIFTLDYGEEQAIKEEIYLGIIRLAASLGIRFAFPSRALYIEDFPEKKTLVPSYDTSPDELEKRLQTFVATFGEQMKNKHPEDRS